MKAYTVSTLAAEWECSEGLIRKLIKSGELRCFRPGGVLIRISAEEVRRFECQNIPSSDSEAASPSSIETLTESGTESGFEPPIVLGLRRKQGEDGPRGATVLAGRWARS